MALKKAAPQQARLKVGVYGPPGSGKTFTALLLAEGLAKRDGKRIAYFDTERGTDFYAMDVKERAVHPNAFDFDADYTASLAEITEQVHGLDPAVYSVVVLDSISHIWDAAMNAYTGKRTSKDTIPFNAWGTIKKPYKALLRFLLDSPFHVLILGRQKNIFESDGDETKKVGVGMRAEGETEYEPHLCFRMESKKGAVGQRAEVYAIVEKDRTGVLAGKVLPNPSFSTFAPLLPLLGDAQAKSEDPDEVSARDGELLRKEDDKVAEKAVKSATLLSDFRGSLLGAATLEALAAVARDLKKQSKYLTDDHRGALLSIYEERRKALVERLAPQEV